MYNKVISVRAHIHLSNFDQSHMPLSTTILGTKFKFLFSFNMLQQSIIVLHVANNKLIEIDIELYIST